MNERARAAALLPTVNLEKPGAVISVLCHRKIRITNPALSPGSRHMVGNSAHNFKVSPKAGFSQAEMQGRDARQSCVPASAPVCACCTASAVKMCSLSTTASVDGLVFHSF